MAVTQVNTGTGLTGGPITTTGTVALGFAALGDTLYGTGAATGAVLSGNITSRRQYLAQSGTGAASAAPSWTPGPTYNVLDYGIVTGGAIDQSSAINSLISSLPSNSGLYFPTGSYLINAGLSCTSGNISIFGDGPMGTIFTSNSTTAAIITSSGISLSLQGLRFITTNTRAFGNPILNISAGDFWMDNCSGSFAGDGLLVAANVLVINNIVFAGSGMNGPLLKSVGSDGTVTNSTFLSYSPQFVPGSGQPCLWISGTTGFNLANCDFGGGGPKAVYTPSSMSSNGSVITVNTSVAHLFQVGDYICLYGQSTSGYAGAWRVVTVGSMTLTCKALPGTGIAVPASGSASGSLGLAYTVPCCALVENSVSACDESMWTNTIFGAGTEGTTADPMSAAVYFDGRASVNTIEGWELSNLYFDFGNNSGMGIGCLITGYAGSIGVTSTRFVISNITGTASFYMLDVEQTPGVIISNTMSAERDQLPGSSYAYIYSTGLAPTCDGLQINNAQLGGCSSYISSRITGSPSIIPNYGLTIDGTLNNAIFTGNFIWGTVAAVQILNSGITNSSTMVSSGNICYATAAYPSAVDLFPVFTGTSTFNMPWNDAVAFVGGTIDTITGGWTGREVSVLVAIATTFDNYTVAGGNIASPTTAVPGQTMIHLFMQNGYWYIMS